jgi:TRAP-type mannitol/chloroaromatic compound transport system permease small subunit
LRRVGFFAKLENIVSVIKSIIKWIEWVVDKTGHVFMFIAPVTMIVITIEVVSRRIFHHPTLWAYETIIMTSAAYVLLICAYAYQHGADVAVDILSVHFPPMMAHIVQALCFLVFFLPFTLGILPAICGFFWDSWKTQEESMSAWAPKLWPVKLSFVVGWILLLAQGVAEMLKLVIWFVWGRKEPPAEEAKIVNNAPQPEAQQ